MTELPHPTQSDPKLPAYLSLRDALAELVHAGTYRASEKLPSERELSDRYGLSRMTARKALGLLEAEGLIHSRDRRGYFVSPPRLRYDPTRHVNLMKLLRQQGLEGENHYLGRQIVAASDTLAESFRAPVGTPLIVERSVVSIAGRRATFEEDYLLMEALPGYAERPYISPMTQNLEQNYGIRAVQTRFRMRVTNISMVAAQHLGVSSETIGFSTLRVVEQDGRVIGLGRDFWLGDAIEIVIETGTSG